MNNISGLIARSFVWALLTWLVASPTIASTIAVPSAHSSYIWPLILLIVVASAVLSAHFVRRRHGQMQKLVSSYQIEIAELQEQIKIGSAHMKDNTRMLRLLGAAQNMDEAAKVAEAFCEHLFPCQAGALYLVGSEDDTLLRSASWGEKDTLPMVLERTSCWALRSGELHRSGRTLGPVCEHFPSEVTSQSVCLPLVSQGELIGVITAQSTGKLTHHELHSRLIDTHTNSLALALHNVRTRALLHQQSIIDPLTGLFNRRYMTATLEREAQRSLRNKEPLSVVQIDLDHFKRVNDTFGHDMGDELLRAVGGVLQQSVRLSDAACRYGGEELTLLLPNCNNADALALAERVRKSINLITLKIGEKLLDNPTASIGIATSPDHGTDPSKLLSIADEALYKAKHAGRNCVISA